MKPTHGMVRLAILIVATGCTFDSNRNGIEDRFERGPDDNANGIGDRFESQLHAQDADGDGYSDLVEFERGTDHRDAESVVYQGGWPALTFDEQQAVLDAQTASSGPCDWALEEDWRLTDVHGERVSLWDFAGADQTVLVVTVWQLCPSRSTDSLMCLAAEEACYTHEKEELGPLRDAIASGDVQLVVVISEDGSGNALDAEQLRWWEELLQIPNAAVLADDPWDPSGSSLVGTLYEETRGLNLWMLLDSNFRLRASMSPYHVAGAIFYGSGGLPRQCVRTIPPE